MSELMGPAILGGSHARPLTAKSLCVCVSSGCVREIGHTDGASVDGGDPEHGRLRRRTHRLGRDWREVTVSDLSAFAELVPLDHGLCVFSTLRGDGSVQSTVVNAGVLQHPLTRAQVVGVVTAGGAGKLRNLRADPRGTIVVRAGWRWAAVDGTA